MIQGRDIDIYNYPSDTTAVLINESAAKMMHFKNPISQIIRGDAGDPQWHIVGVIKDFILESPFEKKVNPMLVFGHKAIFSGNAF